MPRRKGDSKFYVITVMANGSVRAECYREECHWWEDFDDAESANTAMKRHRTTHRGLLSQQKSAPI